MFPAALSGFDVGSFVPIGIPKDSSPPSPEAESSRGGIKDLTRTRGKGGGRAAKGRRDKTLSLRMALSYPDPLRGAESTTQTAKGNQTLEGM